MSGNIFAYFGGGTFQNLSEVILETSNILTSSDRGGHYFSQLRTPNKTFIQDVYLGWSYILFKADGKVFHTGFWKKDCCQHSRQVFSSLENVEVCNIACGFSNTFILSKSGLCYFTQNSNFQLELIKYGTEQYKITKIDVEDLNAVAITEGGKVLTLKFHEKLSVQPLYLPLPVKEVACGKEHVLLLTSCGTIFSYGSGSRGQLGHGSIENLNEPTVIEALDGLEFTAVAAGGWHSAAISNAGDLYMWGWNESGQLGLPCNELQGDKRPIEEIEAICCLPKIIELDEETVKCVGCGSRHTAALTEKNHVWTWGWNGYGQLGHKKNLLSDAADKIELPEHFLPVSLKCKFWSTLIIGNVKVER